MFPFALVNYVVSNNTAVASRTLMRTPSVEIWASDAEKIVPLVDFTRLGAGYELTYPFFEETDTSAAVPVK